MDFQRTPPPHVTDSGHHSNTHCWWTFEFPNGADALVELSKWPFRFDVSFAGASHLDAEGLTSEQVEEKLTEIAALPARVAEDAS